MLDFKDLGRVELVDALRRANRKERTYEWLVMMGVGAIAGAMLISSLKDCETQIPRHTVVSKCGDCHNREMAFMQYFRNRGSRSPEIMALAMVHPAVKNAKLLAAVAVVESNATPTVKNGGYRRQHQGAYQVNPRYHGKVHPSDALAQTLQAQAILEELQAEHGKGFISAYGGDSSETDKYQRLVLAELERTP